MAARALVFDLDGTVWDSRPWYAAVLGRGDEALSDAAHAELCAGVSVAGLLRKAGITRAAFRRLCQDGERCPLYPGVHETLDELCDRGVKLGAATNLPGWIAEPMIEALGLEALADGLVTWGSTSQHKPKPAPLLEALRRIAADPGADSWYVGDDYRDEAAASRAGMSFAWARYGYGSIDPAPSVTVDSFSDVLEL